MSSNEFDQYESTYAETVERSIAFSGLKHDFFMESKAFKLADILSQSGLGKEARLLDVGCGVGALHQHIKPLFGAVTGVDVSEPCIEQARERHPENSYAAYNGHQLPFDDNTFDMSLAVCVLHHVPPPQWDEFLAEMSRVVRPGGLVCLIEHNPLNPLTQLSVFRCPFDADAVLLRAGELRSRLRKADLDHVASEHFVVLPSLHSAARGVEKSLRRLPLGAQYVAMGTVAG